MECSICKKKVHSGTFGTMAGFICKDPACQKKAVKIRKDFFAKAKDWDFEEIKNAAYLNRSLCLFAYRFLEEVKKGNPTGYAKIDPMMRVPEELCLKITEDVLKKLPTGYEESYEARGHERMFHGGTFKLLKPIPAAVLEKALRDAGYIV